MKIVVRRRRDTMLCRAPAPPAGSRSRSVPSSGRRMRLKVAGTSSPSRPPIWAPPQSAPRGNRGLSHCTARP